jgi:hypothetical protein
MRAAGRQTHAIPRLRRWGLLRLSRIVRPESSRIVRVPNRPSMRFRGSEDGGLLRLSRIVPKTAREKLQQALDIFGGLNVTIEMKAVQNALDEMHDSK